MGHLVDRRPHHPSTIVQDGGVAEDQPLPWHVRFSEEELACKEFDGHAEVLSKGIQFLPKDLGAAIRFKKFQRIVQCEES